MATLGSYIRKAKQKAKEGVNTIGSYLMKPVDAWIEKDKEMLRLRNERDNQFKIDNFGSVEAYEKLQEEERARMKKRLEDKQKGTKPSSYVKQK